jgi:hypothetical protein
LPPARPKIRPALLLWLIAPVGLYAVLGLRLIGTGVGYQYDEALYVESAVFLLHGSGTPPPPFAHEPAAWLPLGGRRWPLMIIPYVGTAKAFTALPLFAAFGVSAETARVAGVLLGALGIAGLAAILGTRAGFAAAFLVSLALAIHPSYLDFTVFDNGGVSVWMGAMGLGALALLNHLRRRSGASAFFLGIALGLGVWARANVIWLAASVGLAILIVYGRRAVPSPSHVVAIVAGALVGALPLILYEIRSAFATFDFMKSTRQPLSVDLVVSRLRGLAEVMISDAEQRGIWGGPPLPAWQIGVGAAFAAGGFLCGVLPAGDSEDGRLRRVFGLSAAILTAILLTSRLGIGQHHLVCLLPLVAAALVLFALELSRRSRRAILPLSLIGAVLVVLWIGWDARIERGLARTGGQGVFSSALNDLGAHLAAHPVPPGKLKILNWGFQNNLYVMSSGAVFGTELFGGATKERSPRGKTWREEIEDGGTFLLYRARVSRYPSPAAEGFQEAFAAYTGESRTKLFFDRSLQPLAALVEIPPAGASLPGGRPQ